MRRFSPMTIRFSSAPLPENFAFLLLPRFSNHCLANALEPLRAANALSGRALYRWRLVSVNRDAVASSSGLQIRTEQRLAELGDVDVLFVLPSYDYRRQTTLELSALLKRKAREIDVIGGLDTGSHLLARAGLLDGYRATIHWQELDAFEEEFPRVTVVSDRFVIDRNRVTAGGATTALDLMLHLIGERHGEALRLDLCGLFIYDHPRAGGDPQRALHIAPVPGQGPVVANAIGIMESNLEEPLAIGEVGRRSGCTQRELERRFRRALGATPLFYYRHLRLAAARRMVLETGRQVSEIAVRTGFGSASALTRAFRQHFGDTPRKIRTAMQLEN
jgi:transcriptional regulator GlxA family with amidase domain